MSKSFLFSVLIVSLQLFAQENPEYKNLVSTSNNLVFNFQFDSSRILISQAIELEPGMPETFLILSKIHLWYFLGSKNENDFNSFFSYSDSTIERIDNLLENREDDEYLIYLLGNIYKYRAMAYGANGNSLDAFWATKKAVSFYEDVIDLDSNFYAAYGGIGIFEYALSYVPALFNWALAISGLSADKDNGFTFIEKAYQRSELDKWEFQFHLAKLYDEHLAEYNKSLFLLKTLLVRFPDNVLFRYQRAIEFIKNKNLDSARTELELVLSLNHPKFIQTNSFSNFLLGDIYFRKQDYESAMEHYLNFLTTTQTVDYTGIASLRVAFCYYFVENNNEFEKYTLLAANGNHDLEDDYLAYELSMVLFDEGMTNEREIVINVENNYLAGNDDIALGLINNSLDSLKNDRIKSEILAYKCCILINLKQYGEADTVANEAIELNRESPNWVEPMSLFNLAKINFNKNNFVSAEEFLLEAEDANNYQKKSLIQSYINGLRKKILGNL